MSLYAFGIVEVVRSEERDLVAAFADIARANHANLAIDHVDLGDIEEMSRYGLSPKGLPFSLYSSMSSTCATGLWSEAYHVSRSLIGGYSKLPHNREDLTVTIWPINYDVTLRRTRLGRILVGIAGLSYYERIGIAFVDGGVEAACFGSSEECIAGILRGVALPWDCSPNLLYVWPNPNL